MNKKNFLLSAPTAINRFFVRLAVDQALSGGGIANFERSQAKSFVFTFKTTSASGAIMSRRTGASAFQGWEINLISGKIDYNLAANVVTGNRLRMRTTSAFNDDVLRRFAVTDAGTSLPSGIKMYANASNQTLTTEANNLSSSILNSSSFDVGARNNASENFWTDDLDELAIYTKELSLAEVQAIDANGKHIDIRKLPSASDLYGLWRFTKEDIRNFPIIKDHSGNGRDITANVNMLVTDIKEY